MATQSVRKPIFPSMLYHERQAVYTNSLDTTFPIGDSRLNELTDRARAISIAMKKPQGINVEAQKGPFAMVPFCSAPNIFVPVLTLILPHELPADLQITNLDDSRLKEKSFYLRLASFLHENFGTNQAQSVSWTDMQKVQLYFRFFLEGTEAQIGKAQDFVLCHEVSHILLGHGSESRFKEPKVHIPLFLGVALGTFVLNNARGDTLVRLLPIAYTIFARSNLYRKEYEADGKAAAYLNDSIGAAYLFNAIQAQAKASKTDPDAPMLAKLACKVAITANGDNLLDVFGDHGLDSWRLQRVLDIVGRRTNVPA